ncbi:thioredoxin family protein [Candidatus Sumerlaeota bacterium]
MNTQPARWPRPRTLVDGGQLRPAACGLLLCLLALSPMLRAIPVHDKALTDLDEALFLAAERARETMIVFTAPGNENCRLLDTEVLADDKVQELLKDCLVVRVNAYVSRKWAKRYGVRELPVIVLLDARGRELDRSQTLYFPNDFASFHVRAHDPERNFQALVKEAEEGPANFELQNGLLEEFVRRGQLAAGLKLLERVLETTPAEEREWRIKFAYQRGLLNSQAGRFPQALEALEAFYAEFPNDEKAQDYFFLKTDVLIKMSREPEAKKVLEEFIDKYPTSPRAKQARDMVKHTF